MNAVHDEELSAIVAQQARRLLEGLVTREVQGAADEGQWQQSLWDQAAEAGLLLALVREEDGGVGLSPADAFGIVRLAACAGAPLPLGETLLAKALWCAAGGDAAHGGHGPIALVPGAFRLDGGRLHGESPRVPWAPVATALLLFARDCQGCGHLVLLPRSQASLTDHSRNLAHEPHAALACDALPVESGAVRQAGGWLGSEGLLAHGALLRAQQMVGTMDRCLSYALQYANERVQFGRAIAKFPAVQDLLVEAACQTAAAGAAVDQAVRGWTSGLDEEDGAAFAFRAGVAKARAGEAAGIVAAACHQVHGAIGFTQEHALHHHTRRLWSWRDEFGAESYWQEAIGRVVCARGGADTWPWLTALQDGTQAAP